MPARAALTTPESAAGALVTGVGVLTESDRGTVVRNDVGTGIGAAATASARICGVGVSTYGRSVSTLERKARTSVTASLNVDRITTAGEPAGVAFCIVYDRYDVPALVRTSYAATATCFPAIVETLAASCLAGMTSPNVPASSCANFRNQSMTVVPAHAIGPSSSARASRVIRPPLRVATGRSMVVSIVHPPGGIGRWAWSDTDVSASAAHIRVDTMAASAGARIAEVCVSTLIACPCRGSPPYPASRSRHACRRERRTAAGSRVRRHNAPRDSSRR